MWENFLTVVRQVAILFALVGVGWAARKRQWLTDEAASGCVKLLVNLVTPALIIHVFERPFRAEALQALLIAAGVVVFAHAVGYLLGRICLHTHRAETTRVLRFAVLFSNAGFMGIPLEYAILGAEGAFYGAIYVIGFNLLCWTLGLAIIRPPSAAMARTNWRGLMLNPGTIGIYLGLPLFLNSWVLPPVLHETVGYLADLNTPLAMVVIGYYLGGAQLGKSLRRASTYIATALRLIVVPLSVLALLYFLKVQNRTMAVAMVTAASAPVAALTTMLAAQFHQDVQTSVAIVAFTTFLSIFTMPPIIAIALWVL